MSSDKTSALRASQAPAAPALSPIVQLLPTGYRDIQPFQRGQGWHSNGKATAKLRHAREASERVVFPVIPTAYNGGTSATSEPVATGPSVSVVVETGRYDMPLRDDSDDVREREQAERRAMSPSASAIPVPPPRRPSSSGLQGEGNQRSSSSGSVRTRAIAASSQKLFVSPTASDSEKARDEEDDTPPPDPETMEKLWQEYNTRTRHPTKTVDKEAYHRKMQHRYNETKALRERIGRLEMELEDTQRERDEALEAAQRSAEEAAQSKKRRDPELDEPGFSGTLSMAMGGDLSVNSDNAVSNHASVGHNKAERTFASIAARVSVSQKLQQRKHPPAISNPEEVSYREKATKLERTIAGAKEGVAQLQARLMAMHETDCETIERLRAQLQLEQQASKLLSVQLRETNAAFRSTADELVSTQVALEKEQIEKQIVVEHIQAETKQLLSDQRRKELQSRVKNVVRTLGKEALHQKMEALHTRVMTAEHHMRVAQLEVVRLQQERDLQQQRIDEILASREIKYHCLASQDGGIPGILRRATTLYQGTRTINDQFVLVHMLYEDWRGPTDPSVDNDSYQPEPPHDPEDGYSIHILIYEAFTAQDDYITFHLRDIQRLVPDAQKYLARFADRKKERFLELAELLLKHCHLGYKNGHIILAERPSGQLEDTDREKCEIVIYRGARFIRSRSTSLQGSCSEALVDLVINEVHNPSMSQQWWLEIQATMIDDADNQEHESHLAVDSQVLKTVVMTFASYRPSESVHALNRGGAMDESDAFGIHEDLLEPLFKRLEWRTSAHSDNQEASGLLLVDTDGVTIMCGGKAVVDAEHVDGEETKTQPDPTDSGESEFDGGNTPSVNTTRVLDHRSIVNVSNVFFCVRIEEIWDGELMLRVTMEEPDDAMTRYQTTLLEKDIAVIAAHLFKTGTCDINHSATIKFGLPPILHDPICRLLKKYAQPVLHPAAATARSRMDAISHRISFGNLLKDTRTCDESLRKPVAELQTVTLTEAFVVGRRSIDQVIIVGGAIHDQLVRELLDATFAESGSALHRRQRAGYRTHTDCKFVMAHVHTGFPEPLEDTIVIDLWDIQSATGSVKPSVVLSRISLHHTLEILGYRDSSPPAVE